MKESIYKISFEDFIENVKIKCPDLFYLIKKRYKEEFRPALNSEENLSDLGDSDYQLTMRRVNSKTRNSKFDLIFKYTGPDTNLIKEYLAEINEH